MAAPAQHAPEPGRLYRIGDVSRLTGTKPFVLRFWETEFPMLQPVKTPKGHRLYRQEDIDLIQAIKRLLYEEGFTIAGARRHLSERLGNGQGLATEPTDRAADGPSLDREARETPVSAPSSAPERRAAVFEQLQLGEPPSAEAYRTLLNVREELRAILTLLGTQ
jgi:DNA-binding transcriptional MerR regulator